MRLLAVLLASLVSASPVLAACGGGFSDFVKGLKSEAIAQGQSAETVFPLLGDQLRRVHRCRRADGGRRTRER